VKIREELISVICGWVFTTD